MQVDGRHFRTIWLNDDGWSVEIIDQTLFPHRFETVTLRSVDDAAHAIKVMRVRGAAPWSGRQPRMESASRREVDASDEAIELACGRLLATRPDRRQSPLGRR